MIFKFTLLIGVRPQAEFVGLEHLRSLLLLDVASKRGLCYSSAGTCKVGSRPQSWKTTSQARELVTQNVASESFELSSQLRNRPTRVGLNKHVNVVRHHLQGNDRSLQFLCLFSEEFPESLLYGFNQNWTPVLRAPNQVKLERVHGSSVFCVSRNNNSTSSIQLSDNKAQERTAFRRQLKQAVPCL